MEKKFKKFRIEYDSLGPVRLPQDVYYGAQTQRAIDNFPISGRRIPLCFVKAYTRLKIAAAISNQKAKKLSPSISKAIIQAGEEVIRGKFNDQFVVDVYQAGAGTSQNMNMNEVLANRALEILGMEKGAYDSVNPNDHVNMSQSTNDTFHAALHMAAYELSVELAGEMHMLQEILQEKAEAFKEVYKAGRTHLQDAVPMSLGQEFGGYASMVEKNIERLLHAKEEIVYLPIGGTAIGTGLNTHADYKEEVLYEIKRRTGFPFILADNFFEIMQNCDAIVSLSGVLKTFSVGLTKLANDLRLLSSGPYGGLNEISLPAVQPGSSIMPGKVNPAMAEMVNMVAYQVSGHDTVLTEAAQAAQLELNVMMPVIAYNILDSLQILTNAIRAFREKCIVGIEANEAVCLRYLEKNPIVITALTPHLGYEQAAAIVKRAYEEKRTIKEIILEEKLFSKKELEQLVDYEKLVKSPS